MFLIGFFFSCTENSPLIKLWPYILFAVICLAAGSSYAACANPTGAEAEIRYNTDYNVYQYCDDTNWRAMGPAPSAATPPTTSGLIGYWALDDGSGTTAADPIGSHPGTLTNGPTWATGYISNAVNFDGTNDYINIPYVAAFNQTGDFTLSAWIYADSSTGIRRIVTLPGDEAAGSEHYSLLLNSGSLEFWVANDSMSVGVSVVGQWVHVAATISGTSMKLYENGVQISSHTWINTGGGRFSRTSGNLAIGRYGPTWGQYFDGKIDDVRIYNRALTAGEIATMEAWAGSTTCTSPTGTEREIRYNTDYHTYQYCNGTNWAAMSPTAGGGGAPTSGLLAYWALDEGSGTAASDSANNYDGTLTSGPTWAAGQVGGAVTFDGTNDYINIPYNAALYLIGDLTLSAWINATTTASMRRIVNMPADGTSGTEGYSLMLNAGTAQFWMSGGACDGWDSSVSTPYTFTGSWHHIAGTVSGTTMKIYIDGALANTRTCPRSASPYVTGNLQIGRFSSGWGQYFSGSIDEVRIYNRALSAGEIASIYTLVGSCANPDGLEGEMRYNTAHHVYQFCNGTEWRAVGK